MRSRRSCTGIGRNRCQNVRGEGVPVPPENGFQVKIRLLYPFRDLRFSGLQAVLLKIRFSSAAGILMEDGVVMAASSMWFFLPTVVPQEISKRAVKGRGSGRGLFRKPTARAVLAV